MPVRLSRFYPPSENAILGTLTAAWLCKPLFSYFQSGRIWHCFLHSFPTKLAHLHIGCKCPSNDIEVVLSGQMEYLQKIFFSCWIWLLWKAEELWVTAENTLPARSAASTHGWSPTPSSRSTLRQFIDTFLFPSPPNCCLTQPSTLKHFAIWTLWQISCGNKYF